ncbi:MAG: T9SS type A sorting domain-containing protein [Saprospiraceae bacterium]|nr:T9SS type A sorting domain-containing protein [Saprospiraceae bacterium]
MKDTLKLVLLFLLFSLGSAASLSGQSGGDCFGLQLSSHTAEQGDTVCVEVRVSGFMGMVGMQHSVNWDASALQYLSFADLNLPGLTNPSFGNPEPGSIGMAWTDLSLQGVDLADGTIIYSLCFEILAPAGTSTEVWFSNTPVPTEFVHLTGPGMPGEKAAYALMGGSVLVSSGTELPLSITYACAQTSGSCIDGGHLEATVSGGVPPYIWQWTGVNFSSTSESEISGIPEGAYQLVVTDANGSTVKASFQAGDGNMEITDYTITPVACSSSNLTGAISINAVSGASGNISYHWNTGEMTPAIEVSTPGTYSVVLTDEAGCSIVTDFEVPGATPFVVTETITPPVCNNQSDGSISLSVSPSGDYAFAWSTNANAQNITNLDEGIYSVTVTNLESGCSQTETYELVSSGLGILFLFTGCDTPNSTVTMQAITTEGTGPYTYLWSNGETTPSIDVPNVQGTVYSVTITDANGCSDHSSQAVNCVNGQATLSLTGATINPGESVCLDVAISNTIPVGAMALEFNWDENILQFDSITNLQMPNPQAGWILSEPGVLNFLWADSSTPYPAQASPVLLMEVCFTALQAGNTSVVFSSDPSETYLLEASVFQQLALFTTGNTVSVNGNSQHAIGIRATENTAVSNDDVCIEIKATNFEDIAHLSGDMNWNPAQLEFVSVQSLHPESGLSPLDFNTAQTDLGLLRLDWTAGSGESTSLPNETTLYTVCFNAIGTPGNAPISWSNLVSQNADALDLVIAAIDGKVVILPSANNNYAELSLAPGAVLNAGQDTCIAVKAVRFEAIYALQFSINWDPTLIRLDSVLTADLPAVSTTANFGYFPGAGNLTFSWIDPTLTTGVTLMEGASLFDLCFSAMGPAGISPVTFEDQPTAIEVVDANEVIPFLGQGGFVIVPDQNVWPGDTDNNGHVNHFDLLPIGIGFGATGPQRQNATIDWVGQYADDWSQYTPSSAINYKHIDTNGDGTIAAADTLAVSQNWGLSVNPFLPDAPVFEPRVLGVPLYVLADTLAPSEVAALDIVLGTNDLPAENVYGIAFSITYNPELIVPGSVSASFLNSWLGEQNSDLMGIFRVSPTQDRIDIAITRTDGLNNSGNGAIGKLHITIEDVIFRNTVFRRAEFGIENVRLIDRDELDIPVAPEYSTSWVSVSTGTENPELANRIQLYPTPVSNTLFVKMEGLNLLGVQVLDQYGRVAANFEQPEHGLDVSQLVPGVYVAKIATDRGVAYKTIAVVR